MCGGLQFIPMPPYGAPASGRTLVPSICVLRFGASWFVDTCNSTSFPLNSPDLWNFEFDYIMDTYIYIAVLMVTKLIN